MSRKNIFEILAEDFNIIDEVNKISNLLEHSKLIVEYKNPKIDRLVLSSYKKLEVGRTVLDIVDEYYFHKWKQKSRCVNSKEMAEKFFAYIGTRDIKGALPYLEFAVNMIYLCDKVIKEQEFSCYNDFSVLVGNIGSTLDCLNMTVKYCKEEEKAIIVEKNVAATAVAEIVDTDLAFSVIEYNHHLLKGDINKKKAILNALANKIEPDRKTLSGLNKSLEDELFYMLNNINIRHNNKVKNKLKMTDKKLEGWYDETYQLALLAILLIDNIERSKKIRELKKTLHSL